MSDTCAATATTSTLAPNRSARSKPSERAASEPLDPSVPTRIVAIGPSFPLAGQDIPGRTAHTLQQPQRLEALARRAPPFTHQAGGPDAPRARSTASLPALGPPAPAGASL